MKKLLVIILIPTLSGCVSWENQASLSTNQNNSSIQDLESSFSPTNEINQQQ
jgi:hypothetical protein